MGSGSMSSAVVVNVVVKPPPVNKEAGPKTGL